MKRLFGELGVGRRIILKCEMLGSGDYGLWCRTSLVDVYQHFRGSCHLHLQGRCLRIWCCVWNG